MYLLYHGDLYMKLWKGKKKAVLDIEFKYDAVNAKILGHLLLYERCAALCCAVLEVEDDCQLRH